MEICRWTLLNYIDYCFFFQVGTLSRSGDNKIFRSGRRMYMYTVTPLMDELLKKIINEMGGDIPGGNFLGGNFPRGSLMGGSFLGGNFAGGEFS